MNVIGNLAKKEKKKGERKRYKIIDFYVVNKSSDLSVICQRFFKAILSLSYAQD